MVENAELEVPVVESTPAEKLGWGDFSIGVGLAAVFAVLSLVWQAPGLMPETWADAAIASGARPAADILPGYWRLIVKAVYALGGVGAGNLLLRYGGILLMSVTGALVYFGFRRALALSIRSDGNQRRRRLAVTRMAAATGAFLLLCADPMWRAAQTLAPETILICLTVLTLHAFLRFLQGGQFGAVYMSMFLFGLLSADTPFGFVLLAFAWTIYGFCDRGMLATFLPFRNPFVEQVSKWQMTFLFFVGLFSGIAANCLSFAWAQGLVANEFDIGSLPLVYAKEMWAHVIQAGTLMGWVISLPVVLLPFALALFLFQRSVDEEHFLPYRFGVLYLLAALVSLAEFCMLRALWFWRAFPIPSRFLLLVMMLMLAFTLVLALAVLGVDAYSRNHRRLILFFHPEISAADLSRSRVPRGLLRVIRVTMFFLVPLLCVAAVVPGRRNVGLRQMLTLMDAYVDEVLAECGDAQWLFTDGSYDDVIETRAAARGLGVQALSFMAHNSPRERYLRLRHQVDKEDELTLGCGAPNALRSWMRDKPERFAKCAIQLGFELWRRDGKALPPCAGVLCRPTNPDDAARVKGVQDAHALAKALLDFYASGANLDEATPFVHELFDFAAWRVARMCEMRADRADALGQREEAIAEKKLADDLYVKNDSVKKMRVALDRQREIAMRQMTPREGLHLALVRADFKMARQYAEPILNADPDDLDGNFGMGMSYFTEEQWSRAEEYLCRCLIRNPREPAVYNNLAIAQLKTGRYDAAEKNVRKALELLPDSDEVKGTLKQILDAKTSALKPKTL